MPKYDNQPLVDVALRLSYIKSFPSSIAFYYDALEKIAEENDAFLDATFEPPPGIPARFGPPGIHVTHQDSTSTKLFTNLLAVHWQGLTSASYPGFPSLVKRLQRATAGLNAIFPNDDIRVVNLSYTTQLRAEDLNSSFSQGVLCEEFMSFSRPLQFLQRGNDNEGYERRFELNVGEDSMLLTTACGKVLLEGEDPYDLLSRLNQKLNNSFEKLITQEVQNQWQRQPQH